jgi:hypothetical protein
MATLGIYNKGPALPFLKALARKDFWHDFTGAKIADALDLVGKSFDPSCKLTPKQYLLNFQKLKAAINARVWTNASAMFEDKIDKILPAGAYAPLPGDENAATESVGLRLVALRQELTEKPGPDIYPLNAGNLVQINGNNGNITHSYSINACSTKFRSRPFTIATAFSLVAPAEAPVRNFVIIIDATFVSMSKLQEIYERPPPPGVTYNFFLINSLENESDPAEKLENIKGAGVPNINIFYLKDYGYTANYPAFMTSEIDQMSNLFTTLSLKSYRNGDGLISVDITRTDGTTITINNVGDASEINRATFFALKKCVEVGWNGVTDLPPTVWEEILLYFLLKRAGDWCQALCLLDRDRKYMVYDINNNAVREADGSPKIITLNNFKALDPLLEILLMTHDRILLAFALYLGLNVGYSIRTVVPAIRDDTSTSATWLVYMKNVLDAAVSAEMLAAKLAEVTALFATVAPANTKLTELQAAIVGIVTTLAGTTPAIFAVNFDIFIIKIRLILHVLKQLTSLTELGSIFSNLEANRTKLATLSYAELLKVQSDITNLVTISTTHTNMLEALTMINNSNFSFTSAPAAHTPATFADEVTIIGAVNALLNGTGIIVSPKNGPVAEYQKFKSLVIKNIHIDKGIIENIHPNLDVLVRTLLTIIAIPAGFSRVKNQKYEVVKKDINTAFGLIQAGAGEGDTAIIMNIQNNIISLKERYSPYDLTETTLYIQTTFNPTEPIIALRDQLYLYYIGRNILEPTISDLVINILDERRILGRDLTPAEISAIEAEYITVTPNYNVFKYGMQILDGDNRSFTVIDKFLLFPEQANYFETIIPALFTEPAKFDNPFSGQFVIWRFPLYTLDYYERELRSLQLIDDDEDADNIDNSYGDTEFEKLKLLYTPVLYLGSIIDTYSPEKVGIFYQHFYNNSPLPVFEIARAITKGEILYTLTLVRLRYMFSYYTNIRITLTTDEYIDIILNVCSNSTALGALAMHIPNPIIQEIILIAQYLVSIQNANMLFPKIDGGGFALTAMGGDPRNMLALVFQALYYATQNPVYHDRVAPMLQVFNDIFRDPVYEPLRGVIPTIDPTFSKFKNMAITHGRAILAALQGNYDGARGEIATVASVIIPDGTIAVEHNRILVTADLTANVANTLWILGQLTPGNIIDFIVAQPNAALVRQFIVSKGIISLPFAGGTRKSLRKTRKRRMTPRKPKINKKRATRRR